MVEVLELIKYCSYDPAVNVALDEVLLESIRRGLRGDTIRIWFNPTSVVIGYSLNPCDEVYCGETLRLGIPIIRRISGGGAVYHDLGNINISIIRRSSGMKKIEVIYSEATSLIISALSRLGVKAWVENMSDVVVNGFKVSGSAAAIKSGGYIVHSTLLVSSNIDLLKRLIKPRLDRVARGEVTIAKYNPGNLRDLSRVTVRETLEALVSTIESLYGPIVESEIEYTELSEALKLAEKRRVPIKALENFQ